MKLNIIKLTVVIVEDGMEVGTLTFSANIKKPTRKSDSQDKFITEWVRRKVEEHYMVEDIEVIKTSNDEEDKNYIAYVIISTEEQL